MSRESILAAIIAITVGFGFGWFAGTNYERKNYDYLLQGDGWEIRARDYNKEKEQERQESYRQRTRVWPFVDIEKEGPVK